jgi:hypothetical protein
MWRNALVLLAICVTALVSLGGPSPAAAASCSYPGDGYCHYASNINLYTYADSACWWINGEACSAYNTWIQNAVQFGGTITGQVYQGFENTSTTRGRIFTPTPTQTYAITPGTLQMSGSLRANISWWSGTTNLVTDAKAHT